MMAQTLAEQTLSRVCNYLSAMGVELTREVTMEVLKLVETGLASTHEDPIHVVMAKVKDHFAIQDPVLPPTTPPIRRRSMGYSE